MTTSFENQMSPAVSEALQAGEMLRLISAGTATAKFTKSKLSLLSNALSKT